MLDKDFKGAADRFMTKLKQNGFTMARSQNTEEDYTATKQDRDSKAVEDFMQTDIFRYIMALR